MRKEGRIERDSRRSNAVWLRKIVQMGHVVLQQLEAELMIGKTMILLRTVRSAEETPRRRHHKFKENYEYQIKLLNIRQYMTSRLTSSPCYQCQSVL
jgi:hypothetical protein